MDEVNQDAPTGATKEQHMSDTMMSPSISNLATALALAQAEVAGAVKDKVNPHLNSRYADLASVWDACRVPLTKNGLAVIQLPFADGPKVKLITRLVHKSGEWISSELTMVAVQNTPQGIGSAITYARRYALSAMVGVAPEEDDGTAASHRTPPTQAPSRLQQEPPPPEEPPAGEPPHDPETGEVEEPVEEPVILVRLRAALAAKKILSKEQKAAATREIGKLSGAAKEQAAKLYNEVAKLSSAA
jgi:hypothetical protein